jgi:hypothetical protein
LWWKLRRVDRRLGLCLVLNYIKLFAIMAVVRPFDEVPVCVLPIS